MTDFKKVIFSSKSVHWDTPLPIFQELHKEFHFNQDPTNRPLIGPGFKDGLRTKWLLAGGIKTRNYINPPYKRGLVNTWVEKAIYEAKRGHSELSVFLIPLRNSDYFKTLRKANAEFRLCDRRLKFGDHDNSASNAAGAPFDSVIAIIR